MSREIYNTEDIIDSRDIISRIEELESELAEGLVTVAAGGLSKDEYDELSNELISLRKLAEEAEGSPDWMWGETLIRDSYFEEYARQLAEDIGAIDRNAQWPLQHIDWEAAANDLKHDFICVNFDGVEYWIRG